jgi:UDP-N-acetylmuramate: L-alanyl-gamma-D-glutamyl-meso-diaminopimelate ligase
MLDAGLRYTSGPQWLAEQVLRDRWVLAVAGTHGKTSTAALLTWMLEQAGLAPGFLIGGVPENFGVSARLGETPFFVVEADEYDTAFFDKRSKFVHYAPRTLVINNLEFDHADIFDNLAMIQRQFHHLVRTVPGSGRIVAPENDPAVDEVLEMGCWTPVERFGTAGKALWSAGDIAPDGSVFSLSLEGRVVAQVNWELSGRHNVHNALAAVAAARHVGVTPAQAIQAVTGFRNVKRRLELLGEVHGIRVYDDFAHHPTAIATTLEGLRGRVGRERILAVLEPRSNSMRMGVHAAGLPAALEAADLAMIYSPPALDWDAQALFRDGSQQVMVFPSVPAIIEAIVDSAKATDHILIMSNGGFENLHQRLLQALRARG